MKIDRGGRIEMSIPRQVYILGGKSWDCVFPYNTVVPPDLFVSEGGAAGI